MCQQIADFYKNSLMRDRFKAFLIHLGISLLVSAILVFCIFYIWYPRPLDIALGVSSVVFILIAADVIIGPALTFVVFKKDKKQLKFDIFFILLIQAAAFLYGAYSIFEARPIWIVFSVDRFDVVTSLDLDKKSQEKATVEYSRQGVLGPHWVAAINPVDLQEKNKIIFESVLGGYDIYQRPNLYVSLESVVNEVSKKTKPLSDLLKFNKKEEVQDLLIKYPLAVGWLPLLARSKSMVVLMDSNSIIIDIVNLNPWSE